MMYFWSRQTQLIPLYDVLPRLMRVTKLDYFPRMMSSRGLMNFLLFLSYDVLPRVNRRFFDVVNWNNGLPKPQLIPSYDVLLRLMRVTKLNYFPRMMSSRGLMYLLVFLSFDDFPRVNRRFFLMWRWNNGLPKPEWDMALSLTYGTWFSTKNL